MMVVPHVGVRSFVYVHEGSLSPSLSRLCKAADSTRSKHSPWRGHPDTPSRSYGMSDDLYTYVLYRNRVVTQFCMLLHVLYGAICRSRAFSFSVQDIYMYRQVGR